MDFKPERGPAVIQFLTGLSLLVGIGVSVTLALFQWRVSPLSELVGTNAVEYHQRIAVLRALGAAAGVVTVAVAILSLRASRRAERVLHWGRLLSPLLLCAALPSLFARGSWVTLELEYLIILGITGLLLEQLLTLALGELRPISAPAEPVAPPARAAWRRWLPAGLVGLAVIYYAVLISHFTLLSHMRMATSTADLGEYDNQFFNSLHGHPFRLPASEGNLKDWSALKFHADFIIYFLLPFYAIKPGPEVLLIIQSVVVAFTAVPIYLFGARRLPPWIAAVVAMAYLLLPVVERPNFYDFHAVPVGMFFVAWAIWAVDRILASPAPRPRDYALFWASFVLALLCREDIAFGMLIVSLFLLFYGKRLKLAASMLAVSGLYFVVIKFLIMPRLGLVWYHGVYNSIKSSGFKGYGAVVVSILTNPVFVLRSMLTGPKLLYLLHMLVPLLFLWVRRKYLLVAALPSLFFTLMVTDRPPMYQTSFQYAYQWLPYIVIASVLALWHLRESAVRQTAAALSLAFVATATSYHYGALLGNRSILGGFGEKQLRITAEERSRYRDLQALVKQIPPEASVAATGAEGPHVSTRLELYTIYYGLDHKPEYLLFDAGVGGDTAAQLAEALHAGGYGIVEQRGRLTLARRGHDTAKNAPVIRQLQRS